MGQSLLNPNQLKDFGIPVWDNPYDSSREIQIEVEDLVNIYTPKSGFSFAYHMAKANNENVGHSLNQFISDFGAPGHFTFDGANVQVGRKTLFQESIRKHEIKAHSRGNHQRNQKEMV